LKKYLNIALVSNQCINERIILADLIKCKATIYSNLWLDVCLAYA